MTAKEVGEGVKAPKLDTLRKVIPGHCFQKSLGWSVVYLVLDVAVVVAAVVLFVGLFGLPSSWGGEGVSSTSAGGEGECGTGICGGEGGVSGAEAGGEMDGIVSLFGGLVKRWEEIAGGARRGVRSVAEQSGVGMGVLRAVGVCVYTAVAGFYMWCLFVVAHDCGHGTFSAYTWLNDAVGNVVHGGLLVPYWPWRLSHRRHHLHHNHVDDDYSFPWWVRGIIPSGPVASEAASKPSNAAKEESSSSSASAAAAAAAEPGMMADGGPPTPWPKHGHPLTVSWFRPVFPIIGWALYLGGLLEDGNHYIPIQSQRLWRNAPKGEALRAVISTGFCAAWGYAIWSACGGSWLNVGIMYGLPWVFFSFCLVTVTYLQHHGEGSTKVYDDSTWSFTPAAFETVDRTYGLGIDTLSHHITDGHVVHHIFPFAIPHYHLKDATLALQQHLADTETKEIYQHESTYDWALRIFVYLYKYGFYATLVSDSVPPHKPLPGPGVIPHHPKFHNE